MLYYMLSSLTAQCLPGWLHYSGSCYLLVNSEQTWDSSEVNCLRYGSHLVDIHKYDEQQFIYQYITESGKYWIGLNDLNTEGTFVWTSAAPTSYEEWRSVYRYQDTADEDCVAIYGKTRNWHTDSCNLFKRFSFCKTGL